MSRPRSGAHCAVGAFVLATVLASLTGCGAGFDAVTMQPYNPADGTNTEAGDVLLRGITLVTDEPGGPAAVVGAVINESGSTDRLMAAQVVGSSDPGYFPDEEIFLPPGELVPLGTNGTPAVTVTGAPERLRPGSFVRLRLSFAKAGSTTLQVLVQPQTGDYATIEPTPSPTPEPTRTPEPTPTS